MTLLYATAFASGALYYMGLLSSTIAYSQPVVKPANWFTSALERNLGTSLAIWLVSGSMSLVSILRALIGY